ncbi:Multidrug resistance protein NorM [Planctomycetes bacterium Poly30]|uniref:Multidrug-efflux transporter n=1 Tax=Saltatorellus ferox TaxID=2528018 RepID=A0A518EZX6_9BACT|nr:Multidrug resistance protein NorM [Planctomycetes bacterium Poly30]
MARSREETRALEAALSPRKREIRVLTRLAMPILVTNVFWMLVSLVDILMLGRWSSDAVAAALLAGVWVHLTQMLGMGLVMGIDPLVTQGYGARDREMLGRALQRGIIVALIAAVPIVGLRFLTAEFLEATRAFAGWVRGLGQEFAPSVASGLDEAIGSSKLDAPAERYALAQTFATPFFMVYIACRQQLQGRGILRPALIVAAVANLVNLVANWVLIYELEWGITGAGVATGFTRIFMCLTLIWVIHQKRLLRGAWVPWDRESFRLKEILHILRIGIPVGLHFAFEIGAFGATTLLAGLLGVTATVAHGVAINLASMTFMIPLGIGLAATTRIGNLIGERRHGDAQTSAGVALWMGGLSMAAMGVVLYLGREYLPSKYVPDDLDAIRLAALILPIAAAFQVFDGVQVVGSGILRGMGKTVPAAVFNFIAWWIIALPTACYFVLLRDGGLREVWWSLCLGLGVVAVMAAAWVKWRGPASLADR